ncbi:adenine nucleotide alpha hydrolase [Ruegeria hyattellae]|uniref:adenine nucleotide alpha hydrolase n=1 Tax=Ruegeria hyattellae TaxID=3233337 RepID=UPI00355B82AA
MTYRDQLLEVLRRFDRLAIAVSGGVDSLTLAATAAERIPNRVEMFHAVSPAVPEDATRRTREIADARGWRLHVIDAQEFSDPDYLRNPVNRCYFCKSNLYFRIATHTDAPIAAGTNTDDLGDYRPGLIAARQNGVVHPFVEAEMAKPQVRSLAADLGLGEVSSLPAQPCLASRIQTGIGIRVDLLRLAYDIEALVRRALPGSVVRARIRPEGVELELGASVHETLGADHPLLGEIKQKCAAAQLAFAGVSSYRMGSAFVGDKAGG